MGTKKPKVQISVPRSARAPTSRDRVSPQPCRTRPAARPGPRAKDNEHVPEELVPVEPPEIHDDVDIHGRLEGGGHCQAGCRGMRRLTNDAMW